MNVGRAFQAEGMASECKDPELGVVLACLRDTEGPFALAPTRCPLGELPAALAEHASTTDACVLCAEAQGQRPWQRRALLAGGARHICPEGH